MVEALVARCVLRALLHRKEGVELHTDEGCILHLALGSAWVHVASLDTDCGSCCIEVLILEFADLATIEGVGVLCTEFLHIELHYSSSDLLVRSETDLDVSVLELRVLHDVLGSVHNLSYTCFVICSKKSCSVCSDESLALVLGHFRELAWLEAQSGNSLQRDLSAIIVLDDLRLDVGSGSVRRGVSVSDETYSRHIFSAV